MDLQLGDEGGERKGVSADGMAWAKAGMSGTGLRTSLGVVEVTPEFTSPFCLLKRVRPAILLCVLAFSPDRAQHLVYDRP